MSIIAQDEQSRLVDFLDNGKGLYIEGADFAASNNGTPLFEMFGCTYVDNGMPADTGNVSSITGQFGSIVDGKTYSYLYKEPPDNFVDYISANGGTIIFKSQDSLGRAVMYSGPSNNYRTIHSSFVFSALRDGLHTKEQLMDIYLNYLLDQP